MSYWLAFPLMLFLLSPAWLDRWGGSYLAEKLSIEATWDAGAAGNDGQVRTSEGMVGPPRN